MITIITGGRNAGKSTYCKTMIQQTTDVFGYTSEKLIKDDKVIGYEVSGLGHAFSDVLVHETQTFTNEWANKRFHFNKDAYEICSKRIIEAAKQGKTIVIDEIGQYEFKTKQGFYGALVYCIEQDVDVVVTVRNTLLPELTTLIESYNRAYNVIPMASIAGIILASGFSRRYTDGNKLLAKYKGKALIEHVLHTALTSQCLSRIIVVSQYEEIKHICEKYPEVEYIHNEDATEGIAASVRLGVAHLKNQVDGYMFMQADQVLLSVETIRKLIQTVKEESVDSVEPVYNNAVASPKIIAAKYTEALLALRGDEGAKKIISTLNHTRRVTIEDARENTDIDTVEELKKLGEEDEADQ